jgi:hypothetical protein
MKWEEWEMGIGGGWTVSFDRIYKGDHRGASIEEERSRS